MNLQGSGRLLHEGLLACFGKRLINPSEFFPSTLHRKHPRDTGLCFVASFFPSCDFLYELLALCNTTRQAWLFEYSNLDLDHVEPTGVFGDVVEFQFA